MTYSKIILLAVSIESIMMTMFNIYVSMNLIKPHMSVYLNTRYCAHIIRADLYLNVQESNVTLLIVIRIRTALDFDAYLRYPLAANKRPTIELLLLLLLLRQAMSWTIRHRAPRLQLSTFYGAPCSTDCIEVQRRKNEKHTTTCDEI